MNIFCLLNPAGAEAPCKEKMCFCINYDRTRNDHCWRPLPRSRVFFCKIETASKRSMISISAVKLQKVGSLASVFDRCVSKFARGYLRRANRCPNQKARLGYQYHHHFILPFSILASDFISLCNLSSWP